jgi:long-chain acyl-CoA synthetase
MNRSRTDTGPTTLVEFMELGAQRFGAAPALLYKPGLRYETWSYSRLLDDARRFAALLESKGLRRGDRILICGPNCPQWVVALFGCAISGVVAVPLDIRSAPDFVERVVTKTEPRLALLSRRNPRTYERLVVPTCYFEDIDDLLRELEPAAVNKMAPDDLFEIMFTSGTTGEPKGVMLTHHNLMADLAGSRDRVPDDPNYRLLSILPLSHMFEQMGGLLLPLSSGANVTYAQNLQPSYLMRAMRERQINLMVVVPQVLTLLMNGIEREATRRSGTRLWRTMLTVGARLPLGWRRILFTSVHKQFGGKLATFFTGGAQLEPGIGRKWEALGVRVIQGYGTTEASPVIAAHSLWNPRYDSVGKPLPNLEVRIAEDGEILARGPNITKGYWQAPEQTAAAFDDGWYRTGDLGFLDAEGNLHLNGRKRDMIALPSGQKVFPEDVEAVLSRHPDVVDAAVVGLAGSAGVEVHAAILLKEQSDAAQVVTWANRQLADHQRIRGFTIWPGEDFPRTHTLKIRKNLVREFLEGSSPAPAASAMATPQQSRSNRLIEILSELSELPPDQIKQESTLGDDLNLDSLRRIELLSMLEEKAGISLDDGAVDGETTVEHLSLLLGGQPASMRRPSFPSWGRSRWCRPIRFLLQQLIAFPALRYLFRTTVNGSENLSSLKKPVVFVANHNLGLDNGIFLMALPSPWRRDIAIAAAAELWKNPVWALLNPLVGNAFPFSREGPVRASMENLVSILGEGWNVLIYPEGELTVGGPIQPFKPGIGLLAVEAMVPIVPLRLVVHSAGSPKKAPFLRHGRLDVEIGEALSFDKSTDYLEATSVIERAVKSLGEAAV